ncbi:HdeD family acid-resistance protein [Phenylobacterium sp.]|uniref:HdeD family acid-resistance protein n=1 Tax=Phenylobacterium sp. TaxID=1871053 RepID=UPI0035B27EA5
MTTDQTAAQPPRAAILFGKAPWWVLLMEGLVLMALGLIAALAPLISALAVTAIVGWVYMFAGGVRLVSSLTHRGPGFVWSLLIGALALAAGFLLLAKPLLGLFSLTVVIGAFFFADAITSFLMAATVGRHSGRMAWLVITGVADLILDAAIFAGLWSGALWLLGLFAAVNLVLIGASLAVVGVTLRAQGPKAL